MASPFSMAVIFALHVTGFSEEEWRLARGDAFCEAECRCDGQMMNCSSTGMETLPTYILGTATIVDLSNNSIGIISSSSLRNWERNIRHLNLSDNKISKVFLSSFKGFTALETLNLNGNIIQYISLNIRENMHLFIKKTKKSYKYECLSTLKVLLIRKNHLVSIPKGLWRLQSLHSLDLSFNEITSIGWNDFQNCIQLTNINLQNNKIATIYPDAFKGLKLLQVLNLANNALKMVAPVTLAVLHLPQFRLGAFKNIIGFLSENFRKRCATACSGTLGTLRTPLLSPSEFDFICEVKMADLLTLKERTVLEGEDVIQICGSTGVHGSEAICWWTLHSRISEDKQDPHIDLDEINNLVIYTINTTKEGLHMCISNMNKNISFYYTRAEEEQLPNPVRNARDVTASRGQGRTQQDFTLAVGLSVIITFICAFCLGFFLRPYIQILCSKIGRDKKTVHEQTYQNQGFSDDSLNEENFESTPSHRAHCAVNCNEISGNAVSSSTPQHVSVHFDEGIAMRPEGTNISSNQVHKHKKYNTPENKDTNISDSENDVEIDMSDHMEEKKAIWQGLYMNNNTSPDDSNQLFNVHAPLGRPSVVTEGSRVDQIAVQSEDELDAFSEQDFTEKPSVLKLQPNQSNARNVGGPRKENAKRKGDDKDIEYSDSNEESGVSAEKKQRQHNLLNGPGNSGNDFSTNGSIDCQLKVTNRDTQNVCHVHEDDMNQERSCPYSVCEMRTMTWDKGRGESTAAVHFNNETQQQTLGNVVPFKIDNDSASSEGDSEAVSCGNKHDSRGSGPLTCQSTKSLWGLPKHLQLSPCTYLKFGEQKVLGEIDCGDHFVENNSTTAIGHMINHNTSMPANDCEKEDFADPVNAKKGGADRYFTEDLNDLSYVKESFNYEDISVDISYDDSETDEGSSFNFSASSSYSESDCTRLKIACQEPNSHSSLTDESSTKMTGLTLNSNNGFSVPTPSKPYPEYILTPERHTDTKESDISPGTAVLSESKADNCKAPDLDFISTNHTTLTEARSNPEVLHARQHVNPIIIKKRDTTCSTPLIIQTEVSEKVAMSTENLHFKENLKPLCESDYSAHMFNIMPFADPKESMLENETLETQDTGEFHMEQTASQNTYAEGLPGADYKSSSQIKEDITFTPRPVHFGSNWATYIYAEPTWQSSGVTEEPPVPNHFDRFVEPNVPEVTNIPGSLLQVQIVTISETRAQEEERDSKERHMDIFPEGISQRELQDTKHGMCMGELQSLSTGKNTLLNETNKMTPDHMDNDPKVKHQGTENSIPTQSLQDLPRGHVQNYFLLPTPSGGLAKTKEHIYSNRNVFSEAANGTSSEELEALPCPVSKYQNSGEPQKINPPEAVQQNPTNTTKSRLFINKKRVFDAFVSSLQSGNKNSPDS